MSICFNGAQCVCQPQDDVLCPHAKPGDWPEDFAHENGCYMNLCIGCGLAFHGHKRRNQCKVCHAQPPKDPQ